MIKKLLLPLILLLTLVGCSLGGSSKTVTLEPITFKFQTVSSVKVLVESERQHAIEGDGYSVMFLVTENPISLDTWKKDLEAQLFTGEEDSPRLVYAQEAIGENGYQWTYRDPAGTFQTVRILVLEVDDVVYHFQVTGVSNAEESLGLEKVFKSLEIVSPE